MNRGGSSQTSYVSLPNELKSAIRESLSLGENGRLRMASKEVVSEGFTLVTMMIVAAKEANFFLTLTSEQLALLSVLEIDYGLPRLPEGLLDVIQGLSRLKELSVAGKAQWQIGGPILLPASLEVLKLRVVTPEDAGIHIMQSLQQTPSLHTLESTCRFNFIDLGVVPTLLKLRRLFLPAVEGVPRGHELLPFLRTLPAAVFNPRLHLGWLSSLWLFAQPLTPSIEFLQPFYDLGLRPSPLATLRSRCLKRWGGADPALALEYIRKGWVSLYQAETCLVDIVKASELVVDTFLEEIFLPLVNLRFEIAVANRIGPLSYPESELLKIQVAAALFSWRGPNGAVPLHVFASWDLYSTVLQHPDRFHLTLTTQFNGLSMGLFMMDSRSSSVHIGPLLAKVPPSPRRLEVLLLAWKDMAEAGRAGHLEPNYLLLMFLTDRPFFQQNQNTIVNAYSQTGTPKAIFELAAFKDDRINLPQLGNVLALLSDPLEAQLISWFEREPAHKSGPELLRCIAAVGVGGSEKLFSKLLELWKLKTDFLCGQNILHNLLEWPTSRLVGPMVTIVKRYFEPSSPALVWADTFGMFPLYYWIQHLFETPDVAEAITELVVYYAAGSAGLVDQDGTAALDRIKNRRLRTTAAVLDRLEASLAVITAHLSSLASPSSPNRLTSAHLIAAIFQPLGDPRDFSSSARNLQNRAVHQHLSSLLSIGPILRNALE